MDKQEIFYLISSGIYMGLEYWLGKTTRTKSGSLLEAILVGAKYAISKMKRGLK